MDPDDQRAEFASFRLSAIAAIDGEARGIDRHLAVRVRAEDFFLGFVGQAVESSPFFPQVCDSLVAGQAFPARVDEHVLVGPEPGRRVRVAG